MARKIKRIAPRGSVNKIILKSLLDGDKYGYEIIKAVEEESNGKIKLKQPSLYSSLNRFEDKHLVESYWQDSEIGGRRHYYTITDKGIEFYKSETDDLLKDKEDSYVKVDEPSNVVDTLPMENDSSDHNDSLFDIDNEDDNIQKYNSHFSVADRMKELLGEDDDDAIATDDFVEDNKLKESVINITSDEEDKFVEDDVVNIASPSELQHIDDVFTDAKEDREIINDVESMIDEHEDHDDVVIDDNYVDTDLHVFSSTHISPSAPTMKQTNKVDTYSPNEYAPDDDSVGNARNMSNVSSIVEEDVTPAPPTKKRKIVIDQNGILKEIDDDYVEKQQNTSVIDNVGMRKDIQSFDNLFTAKPKEKKKEFLKPADKPFIDVEELSDEEKLLRSKQFMEKFDDITMNKLNKKVKDDINYKNILGELVADKDTQESVDPYESENTQYSFDDSPIQDASTIQATENKENSDNYINLDEQYRSYIDVSKYELNKGQKKLKNHKIDTDADTNYEFILYNKARFVCMFYVMLAMLVEVGVAHLIYYKLDLLNNYDNILMIVSYVIPVVLMAVFTLPYLINRNKRKLQSFSLKYSLVFGFILFLIIGIISYAICTFVGMEYQTIGYYIPKLVTPIILASNFILSPIVYNFIVSNSRFY